MVLRLLSPFTIQMTILNLIMEVLSEEITILGQHKRRQQLLRNSIKKRPTPLTTLNTILTMALKLIKFSMERTDLGIIHK